MTPAVPAPAPAIEVAVPAAPVAATLVVAAPVAVQPAVIPAVPEPALPTVAVAPAPAIPVAARVVAAPAKIQPAAASATPKPTPAPVATKPLRPPVKAKPVIVLTTVSGAVYNDVHVDKVEPDGITVSYTPENGGMAITKVSFDVLSDEWRQKYGFDPDKMRAYVEQRNQAAGWWREQMITNYQAAVEKHEAKERAEAEAEAAKAEKENQPTSAKSR
jgi:hypothetical protein